VTSFFGIKVCIFCVFLENVKTDLRKIFFRALEKTLVHYNMHEKALHPAFTLQPVIYPSICVHPLENSHEELDDSHLRLAYELILLINELSKQQYCDFYFCTEYLVHYVKI